MHTPKFSSHTGAPSRKMLAAKAIDRASSDNVDLWVSAGEGLLGKILRGPNPGKAFSLLLFVPASIAFGISCYLAYATLTSSEVAGCGGGTFDCSHVLTSKYSKWMGIPVSILAAANYFVMLLALSAIFFAGVRDTARQISWAMIGFCGIAAGMAAIWFIGLQAFAIGHYCPWCLGAHTCGLVIATALLLKRPFGTPLTIASIGLAGCGTAALIVGQIFAEEPPKFTIIDHNEQTQEKASEDSELSAPEDDEFFAPPLEEDGEMFESPSGDENDTVESGSRSSFRGVASLLGMFSTTAMLTYQPQEEGEQEEGKQEEKKQEDDKQADKKPKRRMVSVKGNLRLDPRQWPLLGSSDAKYIFVELYDYACPHCRATHRAIEGACETMGDDLAVIVLPVPLNTNCNSAITRTGANFGQSCELAKLAVACWKLDPQKFEEFHHWMFEGAACPRYAQAKAKADSLLGREKVDAELRKEAAGKYIKKHVQLYKRIGKGVVPKLLFPTTTVEGEFSSPAALVELVQKRAK